MRAIFLSASVPSAGSSFAETADPFLIQFAVRELIATIVGRRLLIWGGHPAITPMIWSACESLDVDYQTTVELYQSQYFEGQYPEETRQFANVHYVDAVPNDREASLLKMRTEMLSRHELEAAVFIGGMTGIAAEYKLFRALHPEAKTLAVPAPGGAARVLAKQEGIPEAKLNDLDFTVLFHQALGIKPNDPRSVGH